MSKVLRYYQEFGQVRDPFRQYTGRPSILEADLKYIDTIVTANPSLYLDEIQQRLRDIRGVDVSIITLFTFSQIPFFRAAVEGVKERE